MHQCTFMIFTRRSAQVIHVSSDAVRRREGDHGDSGRVRIDGEVGQQFLDKFHLVVEVCCSDTRALVHEEDQLHFAVDSSA